MTAAPATMASATAAILILGVLLLSTAASSTATTSRRPNILFLMADEMDGRIMDPDSPQVKPPMPNLNRLAASGANFAISYNQAPQCVPSRSAMMVGLRTDQIEVWDNFVGGAAVNGSLTDVDHKCVASFNRSFCEAAADRQKAPPTWIDHLAEAGYGINLYGKMHAGFGLDRYPGSIQEFPFNNPTGKATSKEAKELREWTRGLGPETNVKGVVQASKCAHPSESLKRPALSVDYQCMDSCVAALRGGLFSNSSAPQLLYCSIIVPHPPYQSNSTFMQAVANLTVDVPRLVPHGDCHPNDRTTSIIKGLWEMDSFAPEAVIYARRVYFSMCYEADVMLGEILSALDESGERENTFVIMLSDHGEDNFEHRQQGKNNMYDSASRVVTLASGPGIKPGQVLRNTLASLNDVFPTVLDMAGVRLDGPAEERLAGSSLLPLISSSPHGAGLGASSRPRRDYVIAQYHSVFSVTGTFMVRQGSLKLIEYGPNEPFGQNFPPQLFDLETDPWELHDLAQTAPDDVKRLQAILAKELNITEVDSRAKETQRKLFLDTVWQGSKSCQEIFEGIYGKGSLNGSDYDRIQQWTGQRCIFS